jgi:hypothetical protein
MKIKLFVTALIAAVALTSCKKEEEKKPGAVEAPKTENNFFSVAIEASAKKTDDFTLYYTEDGTTNFVDKNAVWHGIHGGKPETLVFKLSEEIIPTDIRLDFGMKPDQDSVIVKNIKVNYYNNTFDIKGSDFFNFFQKNDQFATSVDMANGTLTILKKDGTYKTPYFYPTPLLVENIKKITTAQK